MVMELNYSNSGNLTKTVAPEPLQPNKATWLMSTK